MAETDQTTERCDLPPDTFRPCGLMLVSSFDQVVGCELVEVASHYTKELAQTAKLYAWMTGAGQLSAINDVSIAAFCDRLEQMPARAGASSRHLNHPVEEVIRATSGLNATARDASTIARHRSRMMTLKSVQVPELESRVMPGYRVGLDDAECASIAGWRHRAGYLAVTRLGRVVHGVPLPAFADDRSGGLEPVVRTVIEQAREAYASLTEPGRAFIMTSHEGRAMRLIPGFWAASN